MTKHPFPTGELQRTTEKATRSKRFRSRTAKRWQNCDWKRFTKTLPSRYFVEPACHCGCPKIDKPLRPSILFRLFRKWISGDTLAEAQTRWDPGQLRGFYSHFVGELGAVAALVVGKHCISPNSCPCDSLINSASACGSVNFPANNKTVA